MALIGIRKDILKFLVWVFSLIHFISIIIASVYKNIRLYISYTISQIYIYLACVFILLENSFLKCTMFLLFNRSVYMSKNNRPLSPHLTIYKKPPMVTSILHRMTGICLFFGGSILIWWFILFVFSKYNIFYIELLEFTFIKFCLFCITICFCYHISTGIRHLIWDTGKCFALKCVYLSDVIVLLSSIVLTVLFWFYLI